MTPAATHVPAGARTLPPPKPPKLPSSDAMRPELCGNGRKLGRHLHLDEIDGDRSA